MWLSLPALAGALFLALTLHAARIETPTIDEFAHVPAGYAYLEHGALDLYSKNPPLVKVLMALPGHLFGAVVVPEPNVNSFGWGPWRYGHEFMRANAERYFEIFWSARAVVIGLGAMTGVLLFVWARRLYGTPAAAIATSLFTLSPTVLAHGHLATMDAVCTLTIFASVFALHWAYRRGGGWGRLALAGGIWGVAWLVKFTAVLLLPAYAILIAIYRWPRGGRAVAELAAVLACAVLVVNLAFGFHGSFEPLGEVKLGSHFGRALQNSLPAWLPVPLPHVYVRGFDAQKRDVESGEFPAYLLGRWSREGWWYYDFVAFAVKTPLPMILMLIVCPWFLRRRRLPRDELATLLVPLVVLVFMTTAFNRLNIGVRYLLPAFPFLFLLIASIWARCEGWRPRAAAVAVLVYYAATVASVHPSYLSYFNLAAGGPENGHRILIDSNLDWGQDLYRLKDALDELGVDERIHLLYFGHVDPRLYGIESTLLPDRNVEGVHAVSVTYLLGFPYPATLPNGRMVRIRRPHAQWLQQEEPVARAGSIWIYDTRR